MLPETRTLIEVLVIAASPAVGSFLGVLADRLPRGEEVVFARSACRACGARLGWVELVPVMSYLRQRGRCRHCDAPIGAALPLTELAALVLAVVAAVVTTSSGAMVLASAFLWCLLGAFVVDLLWFRLPDALTAALLVLALGLAGTGTGPTLAGAFYGAVAGSGAFWALRLGYQALRGREGLGLGDVKLMAGIGAGVGVMQVPVVVLVASLFGLVWAAYNHRLRGAALSAQMALPFGSFLSLACAVVWALRA